MSYPVPANETARLEALKELAILDTPSDPGLDAVVQLAREMFGVTVSIISFLDEKRQWFKAGEGLAIKETEREVAFCNHVIASGEPMVVVDATKDERFRENRFVVGEPRIRFYAGVPIAVEPGVFVGSLCVIDTTPREMNEADLRSLVSLGKIAEQLISQHRATSELAKTSAVLNRTNLHFHTALSHISQGVSLFDADQRLVVANDRYRELYGLPRDFLKPGRSLYEILEHRHSNGMAFGLLPSQYVANIPKISVEETHRFADGRTIVICRHPVPGGGWVATHEDVTERAKSEERMIFMALYDQLTGLPNREFLRNKLEGNGSGLIAQTGVTILMLDLDKFKDVNDTLGHSAGDELLRQVAMRLRLSVRESDIVARVGGDEFIILQSGEKDKRQRARALARRLERNLSDPFDVSGNSVNIGTSIGIATSPDDGSSADDLLKKADLALYRAKSSGRGCFRFFSADMLEEIEARRRIELEMRQALVHGEFELHYQTVIDASTLAVCAVEALVRWRHPTRGLLSPLEFIPLAEETGLIVPLGRWILEAACADGLSMPEHVKIAVNFSAVQFRQEKVFNLVFSTLAKSGLCPTRLELEITESVLMGNEEECRLQLRKLKKLGVSIALDDFGTGYSSLSYVTKFPFDKIKIDKSFTVGLGTRMECDAAVSSVMTLARGLNILTTAEGVETSMQFEKLKNAGVNLVQGYLFGRPVPLQLLDFSSKEAPAGLPV